MKTVIAVEPEVAPVDPGAAPSEPDALAVPPSWLADCLELTKPRIAVMALFTVAIGYALGAGADRQPVVLFHVLLGAGLVAAGGSALNQWLERKSDAHMPRTRNRPLPAGRLTSTFALLFGLGLSAAGLAYLALTVPAASLLAATVTVVTYVGVYTPLKRRTVWNTLVGAVPGALPPVIGWTAARGWTDPAGGVALFLILLLWQIPHFLAIAWMYRDDYARGGMKMLPVIDPDGDRTAIVMTTTAAALIPVGLLPTILGMAGPMYTAGASVLGAAFVVQALLFRESRTYRDARKVLRASILYLPGVLGLLLVDGLFPVR